MTCDSRLMREAARPGTGLAPKDESGGAGTVIAQPIFLNPKNESTGPALPRFEAGCRMPTEEGITRTDATHRVMAELANESFVAALKRCIANGGAG